MHFFTMETRNISAVFVTYNWAVTRTFCPTTSLLHWYTTKKYINLVVNSESEKWKEKKKKEKKKKKTLPIGFYKKKHKNFLFILH